MKETLGIILRVTGDLELSSQGTKNQLLNQENGAFVLVHKSDRLLVKSGEVLISMADGSKITLKATSKPYIMTGRGLPTLVDQFRRGGLSRGAGDGRIVYPFSDSRVTLDTFNVRWNSQSIPKAFTLVKLEKLDGLTFTADSEYQLSVIDTDLKLLRNYIKLNGQGRYQISGKAGDSFQSIEFDVVPESLLRSVNAKLSGFSENTTDGLIMRSHICAAARFLGLAQSYMKAASDMSPKSPQVSVLFLQIAKLCGEDKLIELAESRVKQNTPLSP